MPNKNADNNFVNQLLQLEGVLFIAPYLQAIYLNGKLYKTQKSFSPRDRMNFFFKRGISQVNVKINDYTKMECYPDNLSDISNDDIESITKIT